MMRRQNLASLQYVHRVPSCEPQEERCGHSNAIDKREITLGETDEESEQSKESEESGPGSDL